MNINSRFTVVALLLLGLTAQAKTDADLLESIAHVESGMNRKAVGKAGEPADRDALGGQGEQQRRPEKAG